MERQTLSFETKGGHKFSIKSYITFEEIEPHLKIENDLEKSKKMMEISLVSLDGETADALARARQLPFGEYTEIAAKVGEILNGGFPTVK
jgi:hypothetical protein